MGTRAPDGAGAVAVLWRDHAPGPVREGGRARRLGLIGGLGDRAEVHLLAPPAEHSLLARASIFLEALKAAARTSCAQVLIFYPDLPGFLPARAWKLPAVLAWLMALRAVLWLRGRRLVVDVGDIPRWQAPALHLDPPLRSGLLRMLEVVLFGLADRVTVATPQLGEALARDLALPRARFVTLANAGSRALLAQPRRRRRLDAARFLYLGSLDSHQDRGIRTMCAAFLARARGAVELVLIGEGGAWIRDEFPSTRLRVLPPLPEPECGRWLAGSDFALIPYPTSGYYRTVCPAKLPLYALARVPIISTDLEATKDVLARHALGEVLSPEAAFAGWRALARRYRGFRGGRELEALTWERAASALLL